MHAASDAGNEGALGEVAGEAEAQIAWIDSHTPGHRLSTISAHHRQHRGMYVVLARVARIHITLVRRMTAAGTRYQGLVAAQ